MTSNRVGDAILSTGLLAHLIQKYPTARITVACGPAAASLFQGCTSVERVIALKKQRYAGHWARLWAQTVSTFWSIIVDLRGSALAWMLPHVSHFIYRPNDKPIHRVESLRHTMRLDAVPAPQVWLKEEHALRAKEIIPEGPVVALGPTANWGGKQWPPESFLELALRLGSPGGPLAGARVAVFGADGERSMVDALLAGIPLDRTIDLIGKTDLPMAAACLRRCRLFVGNDSGLMHLAAAAGVPTLGLFGPSPEQHYRPWGSHTAFVRTPESFEQIVNVVNYDYRSHESRMTSLSVDTVFAAAQELLARTKENMA